MGNPVKIVTNSTHNESVNGTVLQVTSKFNIFLKSTESQYSELND